MIPTRRWLAGAAALVLLAPVALWWPPALGWMLALDLLWLLLLGTDAALAPAPASVTVAREAPPAFSLGRSFPVLYRWRAARPVTLLAREVLPAPLAPPERPVRSLRLPGGDGVVEERRDIRPVRRGVGEGGAFWLRLRGPLGLVWRQGTIPAPWRAVVFPSLAGLPRRGLAAGGAPRREAGLRAARAAGEGRLFEGLKEWVPGEDTRRIDWKATARRRKVIARTYEDERRQQVLLAVDAGRLSTALIGGAPRLEALIDAALHLAHAAVAQDDDVGVLVFADTIQAYSAPARGRRALRTVLELLAAAEGRVVESDYPRAFRYLATRSRKRALTVLFTDVIDRTASEVFVAQVGTLRPRHVPLAVTVRDPGLEALAAGRPGTTREAFARAAAEELLRAREAALAEMRRRGVVVLDVPPAGAGEAVVRQYQSLKRRGVV